MKILIVVPVDHADFNQLAKEEAESVAAPDTKITVVNLDYGPKSIESRYAEFLATGDILKKAQQAQKDGFDGVFVDCFGEPGVGVVRELVDIPIVGGFEPAVLTAMLISRKFSIVTILRNVNPMAESLAKDLGILGNIASIRDVNIPVLELKDQDNLKKALIEQSQKAIDKDSAEAIVLGCTGMLHVAKEVERILAELGKPAPVIDPTTAAVTMLQSLIRNKLSQSRLTYFTPPEDETVPKE